MKLNYLVESQQLTVDIIFRLFDLDDELRGPVKNYLSGEVLATLFYEPSTRTRLSFESAMLRLGGSVISTENAKEFSSAIKGESLKDTIRTVSSYADVIAMRHFEKGAAKTAVSVSSVPILNAGDGGGQHPTQSLLDLYTIWRELGRVENFCIVMVGDLRYGRTVRSLCYLLGKFQNVKIIFISPDHLSIKNDIKEYLLRHNVSFEEQENLESCLPYADIVYMTRIQKERMSDEELSKSNGSYKITEENLQLLRKPARLLHPLPHVEEISLSASTEQSDLRVASFRQVENGLYLRMALLYYLLLMLLLLFC